MIRFERVNKIYKNKKRKVCALKNVSLSFGDKGLFCIVGESGAGKSTLLNMLCLQDKPNSGDVFIMNKSTKKMKDNELSALRNDYFGIVFQDLNLIDSFNIYDNLTISYLMQNKNIEKNKVIEVLKKLNLDESILNEDIYSLSGGQRQRIAIARALLKDSKVIVCDEPTGSLDEDNSLDIFKILKEIAKDKLVIVVTHNKSLAREFATSVIEINKGEVSSDLQCEDYNVVDYKIKHRVPSLKLLFKLGFNSFRETISKSVLTLISVSVMLSVLLFGVSLITFNEERAIKESFTAMNIYGVMASKSKKLDSYSKREYFNEGDKEIFNELDYIEVNPLYLIDNYLSKTDISYFSSSDKISFFDLQGNLPTNNQEKTEMVITRYVACYCLNLVDENSINDKNELNKLLGKTVSFPTNQCIYVDGELKDLTYDFTISGIYDTKYDVEKEIEGQNELELHSCIFFCDEYYSLIKEKIKGSLKSDFFAYQLYVLNPKVNYFKEELINKKCKDGYEIKFNTKIDSDIVKMKSNVQIYGAITMSASSLFIVIALAFYLNYINYSIESYIDKIKILRSIGFSKLDSSSVFIVQGCVISIICSILSTIVYGIGGVILNNYLRTKLSIYVTPISFDILICILSLICLIIISSIIAVFKVFIKFKGKMIN